VMNQRELIFVMIRDVTEIQHLRKKAMSRQHD